MVATCLAGCAIALGGPDATRAPRVRPRCDTSKALVKVDGTAAVGLGVIGLGLLSTSGAAASVFMVGGALYAASALRGNHVVERCRDDNERFDREIALAQAPPDRVVAPTLPARQVERSAPASAPAAAPAPVVERPASTSSTDDPFHVAVGEAPPPSTRTTPSPPPASATTAPWRDFWREVP